MEKGDELPVVRQPQPVVVGEIAPAMQPQPVVVTGVPVATAMQPQPGVVVGMPQPGYAPGMAQPGFVGLGMAQLPPQRLGRWSSDLFSCCADCCICLSGFFCSCVLLGQLLEKTGTEGCCVKLVASITLLEVVAWATFFYGPEGLFQPIQFVEFVLLCIYTSQVKKKIAKRDNIPTDECNDCLTVWCCLRCTLCQIGRHEYPQSHPGSGTYEFTSRDGLLPRSPRAPVVTV